MSIDRAGHSALAWHMRAPGFHRLALLLSAGGLLSSPAHSTEWVRLEAELDPLLVTSDGLGTHKTTDGVPAFDLTHEGIGYFVLGGGPNFANCAGALLSSGRHVLTAAHCIDTVATANIDLTFTNGAGVDFTPTVTAKAVHPSYDGDLFHGYDVGVVTLAASVDASIPRYDLVSSGFDTLDLGRVTGYGDTGNGADSAEDGSRGDKRVGLNSFESNGLSADLPELFANDSTQIIADFDNGLVVDDFAPNDGFGFFFTLDDLGEGDDEVAPARGDSGGPVFFDVDPGLSVTLAIGGVNSYRLRLVGEDNTGMVVTSDIDDSLNSTFGEFFGAANVGDPAVNSWIVSQIPEPSALALLLLAPAVLGGRRRR